MASLEIALEVLIAELHRQGVLDGEAIANMARRLEEAGEGGLGQEVLGVVLANALDEPRARRATLHVVGPNGGNDED